MSDTATETPKLYKVLKDSTDGPEWQIRVRTPAGWSYPKKGAVIPMSAVAAAHIVPLGFAEPATNETEPTAPQPRKPRVRQPKVVV